MIYKTFGSPVLFFAETTSATDFQQLKIYHLKMVSARQNPIYLILPEIVDTA